ncbi:MAG: hypothetical protein A3H96_16760 [Acidobacteria bacterium RIFCSPLOWO2_02_FULL_67_36]|nr:MAG: hypothetical protein A3H96_16760 [Acidobacteria bacterium RIFCSPLOWO2_02_FULL_67_36]
MRYLALIFAAVAGVSYGTPAQAAGQATPPAQTPPLPAVQAPAAGGALPLPATICDQTVDKPVRLPPAGSPPVVTASMLCFEKQGGASVIDPYTYIYYIQMKGSQTRENQWVRYDEAAERVILADFKRLWATNFLDDLLIDVRDVRYENGVIGKVIVYNMEERQRVKIVDYVGSKRVEQSKIEEELKKKGITIRLDSFIDPGLVRSVAGVVRQLYAEKGYEYAEVKPEIKPVEGGTKTVNLSFVITEGPKVKIGDVEFLGNKAFSDGRLGRQLKENKGKSWLSFVTGAGTYKEEKFADDADNLESFYRDRGYIGARVGQPDLKVLFDDKDGRTRWVQLRIPVTEGRKYKVGEFTFEGNAIVKSEALRPLFKLDKGDTYSEKKIRKGLEKAREVYGSGGYFEFTAYPDLAPRDQPQPPADGAPAGPPPPAPAAAGPPIVDVTMRVQEGKQYFVNRIIFLGNTTTRDNVIRREMSLVEAGPFNTEALKYSVRRLNQLGYFKNLEGDAISVDKTPGADNKVDVKLKFEEQNRNQLTFGAGVSQFDGFFGQLSFQTANFLGRGETFTVSAQQGSRAKNYQLAFSEPFLFDRPITVGADLFIREVDYINVYTQRSTGGNLIYGFQVGGFARMFLNYSYERTRVSDLNSALIDSALTQTNPFLADQLLLGQGTRTISKIGPSFVFNTVDSPIFPTSGQRYTAAIDVAGIGGNTKFVNPRLEAIKYWQQTRRTSLGVRVSTEYIRPIGSTKALPIFEKIFLGGEYSIRGFDLRTIGPRDPISGFVIGGNKSLLANVEYLITIAGPVRLVLFADAGQVRDSGERFVWREAITKQEYPPGSLPLLLDPFATVGLKDPTKPTVVPNTVITGYQQAFKSSIGAEIRFFMPVLNVPFRLIFAMNPSRGGVFDQNGLPEKKWKFRFAVGSTF